MDKLFREAQKYIPGGVNSPVRAFKAVGREPLFIERGIGSKVYDTDGCEYVDYVLSWGPLILGHSHPQVIKKVGSLLSLQNVIWPPDVSSKRDNPDLDSHRPF